MKKIIDIVIDRIIANSTRPRGCNSCKSVERGFDHTGSSVFATAVSFFKNQCGIDIVEFASVCENPDRLCFVVDAVTDITPITPTTFKMSKTSMIDLYFECSSNRLASALIIRAYGSAAKNVGGYEDLKPADTVVKNIISDVKERIYEVIGLKPKSLFEVFDTVETYEAMRELFIEAMEEMVGLTDHKRNICLTCKYCRFDTTKQYCSKMKRTLTSEETKTPNLPILYPDLHVELGELKSSYKQYGVTDCKCYKSNIGLSLKTPEQLIHKSNINMSNIDIK